MEPIKTLGMPNLKWCSEILLYFRHTGPATFLFSESRFEMDRGGTVASNTYFNVIPTRKLAKHSKVRSIGLKLHVQGRFRVSFLVHRIGSAIPVVVYEEIIDSNDPQTPAKVVCPLDIEELKDLFFFRLESLKDSGSFHGGEYYAAAVDSPPNRVKITFATTVFRREAAFRRNERLIHEYFQSRPHLSAVFDFLAVDNGRSLEKGPLFRTVAQDNLGSSGGCARAMIEALSSESDCTHLIYSDDDILLDPSVLENTYYLLRLLNDPNQCIAGAMLRMEDKHIQFEFGGRVKNAEFMPRPNRDLRNTTSLVENELDDFVDFGGWWFWCISTTTIRAVGLPMPLFLKFDDVEYGCRLGAAPLTMSGLGVWHESFERKESGLTLCYFDERNRLIFYMLRPGESVYQRAKFVFARFRFMLRWLACYKYKHVELIHTAMQEFFKGPEYVFCIDMQERLGQLGRLRYARRPFSPSNEGPFDDGVAMQHSIPDGHLRRLFRRLTLNGHLLPRRLSRRRRVAPMFAGSGHFFRAETVVHYDVDSEECIEVKRSLLQFTSLLVRSIYYTAKLAIFWSRWRRTYSRAGERYSAMAFWKNFLQIDDANQLQPHNPKHDDKDKANAA